jgi:hypothetical protein
MQAFGVCSLVVLSFSTATAQTNYVPARVTRAVNTEDLVTLGGNTHPLARPEYDRGAAPDSLPMSRVLLVLQRSPEQESAVLQLLEDQQVQSSPNYHKWMTPEQFGQQFGPADADIQAVTGWLMAEGFQVNRVAAGHTVIEFSGTAGLVRQALRTEIHKFTVNGEEHWANASDPQIPAALAPVVAGFASLNNFPRKPLIRRLGTFRRSKATGELTPLFTFTPTGGSTFYAVGPTDFATIYNVLPLWQASSPLDGTGQTIAIVGETNVHIQDVRDFRNMFGLPANDPQIILDGPDPGVAADEVEADLDVQWSGAVAKNATIKLVVSETTESTLGIDLSALYIVDNNIAPVMSESYGACEASLGVAGNAFYNTLWEQAAAQGITVMIAAGDIGSATCDLPGVVAAQGGLAVSGTASTPFNVALGGTDFDDVANQATYWNATNTSTTQASAKSYLPEITWNDSCAQSGLNGCTASSGDLNVTAGGGGPSNTYTKPSWQSGAGVPKDNVRDIPDVSLFASDGKNGSFYIFCQADANSGSNTSSCDLNAPYQDFQGGGGTSFAAPAFAGIMALVNQKTGERQGNANYVLYKLAAQKGASCSSNTAAVSNSSCIFYDVIKGNNSVACVGGSPNCSNTSTASNQYGILVDPKNPTSPAWTTTVGYDRATGLGSVNAANLVNNWTSVSFAPSTTSLTLSPTAITHGQAVNVTASVSSKSGTPTGAVSLIGGPGNSALGIAFFALSNGNVTATTNLLPGGTYGVTAHYAGDGTFGGSDSTPPIQVTVSKEGSMTHVGLVTFDYNTGNVTNLNAATAPYGSPDVLRVNVSNNSGQQCASSPVPCPTGQVTLTDNGKPLDLGNYTLNSQGYFEDQLIQLSVGSHSVVASYAGDNSYQPSASGADALSITKATTTASVTADPSPVPYGSNVTLTAAVDTESNGVAPTGTVQFLNGTTPLNGTVTYMGTSGLPVPPATLQATLKTLLSTTANITVKYSGDGNYLASTSMPLTVTVVPGFTLSANPTSVSISAPGQSGTSSVVVTSGPGFTGTVAFSCTVPATMNEATCSANPSSIVTSGSTTITITTTAPHTVAALFNKPDLLMASGVALLVGLLLVAIPVKKRRSNVVLALLCVALISAVFGGCGGGGSGGSTTTDPGTAAGTYSVTVTATSGTISRTVNVSVTVE